MEEVTESLCATCGTTLAADARVCPNCGAAVGAPQAASNPGSPAPPKLTALQPPPVPTPVAEAPERKGSIWRALGVPLAIVVLVVIIWAVLAGMPFGSRDRQNIEPRPAVETVGEGTSTAPSASIPEQPPMQAPATTTRVITQPARPPLIPPATTTAPVPQPVPSTATVAPPVRQPPPTATSAPVVRLPPPTVTSAPAQQQPPTNDVPQSEITEGGAAAILARYLDGRDPYHRPGDCMSVRGTGYKNRGYGFIVSDRCDNDRVLGRWRVDSVTREVFEQKEDGRYERP